MIALVRNGSGENYDCKTSLVPLSDVARFERKMPSTFLAGSGCDITPAYMEYARPLIGPVEPHALLAFTW
jgi:ATP-dependent phosphofructokinase / diphosphate-dependent phosphofructokinase